MTPAVLRRRPSRAGQSTVEYLLVVSVIVIAVVIAAQTFAPGLQAGLQAMSGDVRGMASRGYVDEGR